MKQFSAILNVILLIAVGILYYFHFKDRHQTGSSISKDVNSPVVFVNSDSITENYELYKLKRSELKEHQAKIRETLQEEGAKLQNQLEEYQKKASVMSKVERDATERKLQEQQQKLYEKRDRLTGELEDKKDKTNENIYVHLTEFIKDYLKKKGLNYNFVLAYQRGGGIIYAKDSLDITKEIVDGLNEEFRKENPLSK